MRGNQKSLFQDKTLRRIVVVSTGLAFVSGFGALAALDADGQNGMRFTWHWKVIPWMLAGAIGNWRVWATVLDSADGGSPADKTKFQVCCGLLIAAGLGAFLYPIRFADQSRWNDIAQGLIIAVVVLGAVGFMIYRLARFFDDADSMQLEREANPTGDRPCE